MTDILLRGSAPQAASYSDSLDVSISLVSPGADDVAPAPVWFTPSVTGDDVGGPAFGEEYDPRFHQLAYVWDYGDAASEVPHRNALLNMPSRWKNTNKGYGPLGAHCFNDPGTYTITCTVYQFSADPARMKRGTGTTTFTVNDPDTVYSGPRTIVYAPNGTAGLTTPAGATVITTNWDDVLTAAAALSQTFRILIAPGVTVTYADGDSRTNVSGWQNCRIGALDPNGAPVRIENTGMNEETFYNNGNTCSEMFFYDLELIGPWDSTTETGRAPSFSECPGRPIGNAAGTFIVGFHRTLFSGFGLQSGVLSYWANTECYSIISDSYWTNWRAYGYFGIDQGTSPTDPVQENFACVGSTMAQNVDALQGGPRRTGPAESFYNDHGCIRLPAIKTCVITASEFFTRGGWSAGPTLASDGLRMMFQQPTMRLASNYASGQRTVLDRVTCEGGLVSADQNDPSNSGAGNTVMDKLFIVSGGMDNFKAPLRLESPGVTVRNLIMARLNQEHPQSLGEFIEAQFTTTDTFLTDVCNIHGATFIDYRTDANANNAAIQALNVASNTSGVTINTDFNVLHQPARTGFPAVAGPSFDLGAFAEGFTPRHKGLRYGFVHQVITLASTVSGSGGTVTIPYSEIGQNRSNADNTQGAATDQAYWLLHAATDTKHRVRHNDVSPFTFHAEFGQIDVSFGATEVTITNLLPSDWPAGTQIGVRFDRSSRLPGFDTRWDATGVTFGTVTPTDTALYGAADTSRAYDDAQETVRRQSGDRFGAIVG